MNRVGHARRSPGACGKSRPVASNGWSGRFILQPSRLICNQSDLDFGDEISGIVAQALPKIILVNI
jgi:hypothetical protein